MFQQGAVDHLGYLCVLVSEVPFYGYTQVPLLRVRGEIASHPIEAKCGVQAGLVTGAFQQPLANQRVHRTIALACDVAPDFLQGVEATAAELLVDTSVVKPRREETSPGLLVDAAPRATATPPCLADST